MKRYRKKYGRRSRRGLRRKYRRVRRRRGGRRRSFARKTYSFKRAQKFEWRFTPDPTAPGDVPINQTLSFKLTDVVNSSEFTTLFDQYRINKVAVVLTPHGNSAELANLNRPILYSRVDYDDVTGYANVNEMMESPNVRSSVGTSKHSVVLRPAVAVPLYQSGVTFAYGPKWKQWVDCSYPSVPHYGVKFYWDAAGTISTSQIYSVRITFYLSFRNVR